MSKFNPEQALARYIELEEQRDAEFRQLPDYQRWVARGECDFVLIPNYGNLSRKPNGTALFLKGSGMGSTSCTP